jgi:hypothetical protein
MVVSTMPAWGIEPTTSSLGAMSPYHQAKARGAVGSPTSTTRHNKIITGVNFLICKGLRAKKLGIFDKSRPIRFDKALFGNIKIDPFGPWTHVRAGFDLESGLKNGLGWKKSTSLIGREAETRLFKFTP